MWDLAAGKSIADLNHTHAVTAVQFNPAELVLATACKDRTIRLWDLDSFEAFDKCGPDTSSATAVGFNPDGQSLFAAFPDSYRMYSLEPATSVHHRLMGWAPVTDLMVSNSSVICCSLSGAAVTVWAGDAQKPAAPAPSEPRAAGEQRRRAAAIDADDDQPPLSNGQSAAEDGVTSAAAQLRDGARLSEAAPAHGTWRKSNNLELQPAAIRSTDGEQDSGKSGSDEAAASGQDGGVSGLRQVLGCPK